MPRRPRKKLSEAGAALYAKEGAAPANAFLAALAAHQAEQCVEVWPENWRAFVLFSRVQTQWNMAMGGPTGLRYEAIYPLLDREAQDAEDWSHLFDDLQVLEGAALKQMSDNRTDN